jgi:response regulator RpfG family c-di-GMP phosphodiesterase
MSDEQSWVIQTEDLQIGTTLSFDLTDGAGQVLHKAGVPINERLKERLQTRNIHSVAVRGAAKSDESLTESLLIVSFSEGSIKAIQDSIVSTQLALCKLIAAVQKNQDGSVAELEDSVGQFLDQASNDVSAALAVIAMVSKNENVDFVDRVAKRSAKLSLLGVVTSVVQANEAHVSMDIGLAGLLHDSSLLLHPEWFSTKIGERGERFLEEYHRHPIESAELVNGTNGISRNVITIITQVHEQADGTGYPRGMKLANTCPEATILNLADAYLALVEPLAGRRHLPSDAISYLCYHAAQGRFSRETMQCMLQGMSIYPIGSKVLLDDESLALVIQSTPGKPLQPVVRLLQSGNMRIDLSQSARFISAPYVATDSTAMERIKKIQMQEILWRTDR